MFYVYMFVEYWAGRWRLVHMWVGKQCCKSLTICFC